MPVKLLLHNYYILALIKIALSEELRLLCSKLANILVLLYHQWEMHLIHHHKFSPLLHAPVPPPPPPPQLHLDHFDTPRPSVSVLSMADCLLQLLVTSQTGRELAETLCTHCVYVLPTMTSRTQFSILSSLFLATGCTGFIQLILELKAKFPGSVEG